jgi:hypothetical protein
MGVTGLAPKRPLGFSDSYQSWPRAGRWMSGLAWPELSLAPLPRLSQVLANVTSEEPARSRQGRRAVQPDIGARQRRQAMLTPERHQRRGSVPDFTTVMAKP